MAQSANKDARHPCLDGLRGLSIALVLYAHATKTAPLTAFKTDLIDLGNLGVRLFFILSGFLFTTMLVEEREKTGTIGLPIFYLRRFLRLMPAFFTFLLVVGLVAALGFVTLEDNDLLCALTFTTNYHPDRAWGLGHLWTFAVAEQFYLVWPATILLFGRRGARSAALGAILLAPVFRTLIYVYAPSLRATIGESFETVVDAIAMGALVALLDRKQGVLGRVLSHGMTPIAAVAIGCAAQTLQPWISLSYTIGETVTNAALATVVAASMTAPRTAFGRLLDSRPMSYLGTISFSLYLAQQPFLDPTRHDWATTFPMSVIGALAAGIALHYAVERPVMKLRSRITKRLRSRAYALATGSLR
ncbi:MAG: acyltransferase [Polyangiaceae bacterium]|nr:acyltransferase [Polyangiaceae bacterium]